MLNKFFFFLNRKKLLIHETWFFMKIKIIKNWIFQNFEFPIKSRETLQKKLVNKKNYRINLRFKNKKNSWMWCSDINCYGNWHKEGLAVEVERMLPKKIPTISIFGKCTDWHKKFIKILDCSSHQYRYKAVYLSLDCSSY